METLINLGLLVIGVVAALAIVSWLLMGAMYAIAGVMRVFDGANSARKRSEWRSRHPLEFDPTAYSARLVEAWISALRLHAIGLDRSYDFDGSEPTPSDRDLEQARLTRRIADWLSTNAPVTELGTLHDTSWHREAAHWHELIDAAAMSESRTAEVLADEPELHWKCRDAATVLQSLSRWLRERANVPASPVHSLQQSREEGQ